MRAKIMSMIRIPQTTLVLGFAIGLFASACAARKAEDACQEYLEALAACPNVEVDPKESCDGVSRKDLDHYECLAAWAKDGCRDDEKPDC